MTTGGRTADHPGPALRWSAGLLVTLPAAAAVLMLSGGDVLVSQDRGSLASRIPGNSVMPALAMLPAADRGAGRDSQHEMAMAALRRAPLTGDALTWLALDAADRGDRSRAAELLALSGRTGWHDEWTQRNLYNTAMRSGDAPTALRHAEALLRQGRGEAELFPRFVQGMKVPEFRAAFFKAIAPAPVWSRRFLVKHGHELDEEALINAATALAKPRRGLDRDIAAPVLTRLVAEGRVGTAVRLWTLVRKEGPQLSWPDELARNAPTPFDWKLPQSFTVEGEGKEAELVATSALPGEAARRLLYLQPGDYHLKAYPADGWLWGAGCLTQPVVPNRRFEPGAHFTVTPDCPGTVIALAPAPGSESVRLRDITVAPLP